ncbi:MAG: pyruvate kinase [Balneolaceae bacterium]|nr:pyruvate kinase [Balneolaceae bacterium]
MLANRRTKIVCTLGPSSQSEELIRGLVDAGMNVARINFSHGTHQQHSDTIKAVRTVASDMNVGIPILADLQGPKVRVGTMMDGGQTIKTGDYLEITTEDITGTSKRIPIDYPGLVDDASEGNRILIDDGLLELKVIKKNANKLTALVLEGGRLKSRKGVNLPEVNLAMSSLTSKDVEDLAFAIQADVEYVALSFVRSPNDLMELISRLRSAGSHAGVIAKIEKPEALTHLDEIIEEATALMVARGDLGIEIASERVPLIQKRIIERSRMAGKPVITATQMLDSMITHSRPTRAESSDVANAVFDGSDAVMLSGETAVGDYPLETVRTMDRICRSIEDHSSRIYGGLDFRKPEWKDKQIVESIAHSVVMLADNVDARAIGTITHSGNTAKRIAKFRPRVPIIAFTESEIVYRQLSLVWGTIPVMLESIFGIDKSVRYMEDYLKSSGLVNSGDRVVLATGMPVTKKKHTNMVKVSTIS